jgi:hypothetical protein
MTDLFINGQIVFLFTTRGSRGRDHMVVKLDLQLPVQSIPIATEIVSSNPVHGDVYSTQHYVIKFVSDLRQVSGFLQVLHFPHQ